MLKYFLLLTVVILLLANCNNVSQHKSKENIMQQFQEGSFGYDLNFLKQHDSVIVLKEGNAQVVVSAKYQGKVFTSTAEGEVGRSFGWINYKAFDGELNKHMNAYGGENRLWLGPEGNRFSLFFKNGEGQIFENWITPAAFDHDAWILENKTSVSASLSKKMELVNYAGTQFYLKINRRISLLKDSGIRNLLEISKINDDIKMVAYSTENSITNTGNQKWVEETGAPCIWMLDMFPPSDKTVIIIPFNQSIKNSLTTNYFGEIPEDRVVVKNGYVFFRADGKSRGKIGINPVAAKSMLASYDAQNKVLTIVTFDLAQHNKAKYLNQEWNTHKLPYTGDAVNAYNDGPLTDGKQMGPFYEMESVSPAAFLKPNETLTHYHNVFHFTGSEIALDNLMKEILGISIHQIPLIK